uniref:Uncharacterized protein n=1 Tax=Solanum tuberosum TaxID=4113 RepID=M1DQU7_SOLTU
MTRDLKTIGANRWTNRRTMDGPTVCPVNHRPALERLNLGFEPQTVVPLTVHRSWRRILSEFLGEAVDGHPQTPPTVHGWCLSVVPSTSDFCKLFFVAHMVLHYLFLGDIRPRMKTKLIGNEGKVLQTLQLHTGN